MKSTVKPYLIVIYGKDNCPMCVKLKNELSLILEDETLARDFELDYQNLSTVEGMTAYAVAETINGQQIPALQIMKYQGDTKSYVKIADKRPEFFDSEIGSSFVPAYLQLQTDYGLANPAIKENDIRELIYLAKE